MTSKIMASGVVVFAWSLLVALLLVFPGIFVVAPYRVISTWIWTECRVRSVSQVEVDYGVFNKKIRSWFVPCPPPPTRGGRGATEDDKNNDDVYLSPCFTIKVDYNKSDGKEVTSTFLYRDISTVDSMDGRKNKIMANCSQRICVDKDFSEADSEAREFIAEYGVIGKTFDCRYNPDNLSQTLLKGPNKTEAICSMLIPSVIWLIVTVIICVSITRYNR